ncbi:hypothetical protein [Paenibacillus assamensis]|uniref:hypothetical protein n=1 Tax=Paenibacillus assamensis TaxID=311244 RepID=UPI00048EACB4|nr:hypothetical protein [Paenibacillus assamensis]
MKKGIIAVALFCMLTTLFIGCSGESRTYASILIYNNQEYIGDNLVAKSQYPNVNQVGSVSKMVRTNQLPTKEFSSNQLSKGTKIYQVDENTLLANWDNERYKLFERKKSS